MSNIVIAPSILSADPGKYAAEISALPGQGADWVHIDVMDGSFVPPITFGTNIVKVARQSCRLPLDVHLMIVNPERHLQSFAEAGADRITIHMEATSAPVEALESIRALGLKSGLCIKPATPVSAVFTLLDHCDLVLIMTVEPGWGGQRFLEHCSDKIAPLRNEIERRALGTIIEVDGGINDMTGAACVKAGARALVAGSYIFSSSDRGAAIKSLKTLAC